MKILLDISILGAAANPHQRGTLGIFRVAEHTARAVLEVPDGEPCFYARQNRAAARRYFEEHLAPRADPRRPARFAEPALPSRTVANVITAADKYLSEQYVHPPWRWLKSGRLLWAGARYFLRGVEPSVSDGLDIYHSLSAGPPQWTDGRPGLVRFLTVYDLIPLLHPEFFSTGRGHILSFLNNITPEDWVLCISESTRRDLLEHVPRCNPESARVAYLAAEDFFHVEHDADKIEAVRERYGIPNGAPYFLSVSVLEPRKNFETIIRAFTDFVRSHPASATRLVLVGKDGWNTHPILAALDESDAEMSARVIFTGYVPDADLAALYSGALAFVYMSIYEGFGLPPLEAMQCGTPVIASNSSSLPEVVGDAGILLPPTDRQGVAEAMGRIAGDAELRRRLSSAGLARAARFSWERFRADVIAAYADAGKRSRQRLS